MAKKTRDPKSKIRFDYLKVDHFRNIHVDGAIGGIAPRGFINMAVYTERLAIPQQTVQPMLQNGNLGTEIGKERVSRNSIIRDLEANLVMDADSAKSIVDWLNKKIKLLEKKGNKTRK